LRQPALNALTFRKKSAYPRAGAAELPRRKAVLPRRRPRAMPAR